MIFKRRNNITQIIHSLVDEKILVKGDDVIHRIYAYDRYLLDAIYMLELGENLSEDILSLILLNEKQYDF